MNTPFELPSGLVLPNRLVKASMTERLAGPNGMPNQKHCKLYRRWAVGNTGLLITGNMLVDPLHRESAANIVLQKDECLPALSKLASAATTTGQKCIVQLNHAGRQTNLFNNLRPLSASDVKLHKMGFFAKPRPMSDDQVMQVIKAFTKGARWIQKAGFDGVQIHAAHGYLLSQFLSPLTNKRTDQWGVTLENRARLLLETVRSVRAACGSSFTISVKINSADFQRGGFEEKDCLLVISWLEEEKIDLLEISGGTYEKLEFFGDASKQKESTRSREAYFLEFASRVRKQSTIPLMVTGGFRSYEFCEKCLQERKLDLIGMARPYLLHEDFSARFMGGALHRANDVQISTGLRAFDDMAAAGFWNLQIKRLAEGKAPGKNFGSWTSFFHLLGLEMGQALKRKCALKI